MSDCAVCGLPVAAENRVMMRRPVRHHTCPVPAEGQAAEALLELARTARRMATLGERTGLTPAQTVATAQLALLVLTSGRLPTAVSTPTPAGIEA